MLWYQPQQEARKEILHSAPEAIQSIPLNLQKVIDVIEFTYFLKQNKIVGKKTLFRVSKGGSGQSWQRLTFCGRAQSPITFLGGALILFWGRTSSPVFPFWGGRVGGPRVQESCFFCPQSPKPLPHPPKKGGRAQESCFFVSRALEIKSLWDPVY